MNSERPNVFRYAVPVLLAVIISVAVGSLMPYDSGAGTNADNTMTPGEKDFRIKFQQWVDNPDKGDIPPPERK